VDVWESFEILAPIRRVETIAHEAEIHWYEADGIGMRWVKIKRFLK
jgi:hypothetical protein